MRIAQDTSADATNARHLENPVGLRRACQHGPLQRLEHVYVGRDFNSHRTDQALISMLLCFLFVLDVPLSILHFPV